MQRDLTEGPVLPAMLKFALPLMLGNLLQQCYNIADTLIVGRYLGADALAAVGSSYTLMTFLTSILLGLCMGSGAVFAIRWGERNSEGLREGIAASFLMIAVITFCLTAGTILAADGIILFLRVPEAVSPLMRAYLTAVFWGLPAVFLYNYAAALLRAIGNSAVPLLFLAVSAVLNIALDLWFVIGFQREIGRAHV